MAVADAFRERGILAGSDGSIDLDRMCGIRPAGGVLDPVGYTISDHGAAMLTELGVPARPDELVRCCVDWSEQRHHIAGPLGRALLNRFHQLGWIIRKPGSRAIQITPDGRTQLSHLGVILA